MNDAPFRRLRDRTMTAAGIGIALVGLSYFFVDRPVAHLVHSRDWNDLPLFRWLTYPPTILQAWTPVLLTAARDPSGNSSAGFRVSQSSGHSF